MEDLISIVVMADGKLLNVGMPWGRETFQYPLRDTLVVRFNK